MSPWPEIDFNELVSDVTGGNAKTLQSDYLSEGTYPIVDQGQALIGGFTNDGSRVCKAELPVIVFGDHTKCFKYIDFPFCLGADGTKVLRPKRSLDERYLFYALQRIHIPDAGYSRHFKYLKEGKIPLPPLEEQKRIAAILDQADELRRKRQCALDRLNQLNQAIFIKMFGDPTTNPKAWPIAKASELANRITVGLVVRPASYYCESGVPAIRGTNIKESGIDLSDVVYFSQQDNDTALAKSRIWSNDIVIVRSGRPGLAAIVPPELHGANAIDVLIFTPNREKVAPQFVRDLINSEGGKRLVLSESRGQVQQHFNVGSLSEAEFFVPPFNLQREYQRRIQELQDQATRFKSAALASDGLFSSLQDRAFRGELTASSLKEAAA